MTDEQDVKVYALSTCGHCKKAKALLNECNVSYDSVEVDLLDSEERQTVLEDVKALNPRCSFPTIRIGEKVIVGYKEDEIKEALGIS
ncbi:MAG: glutaredoxin family protein [Desulfosalsimonas sp.]|uniref:glutaredoxin family protein n=1 Tax=Desulfosalsimonas sp. TaxID=3073848 RepID=UPI003970DE07